MIIAGVICILIAIFYVGGIGVAARIEVRELKEKVKKQDAIIEKESELIDKLVQANKELDEHYFERIESMRKIIEKSLNTYKELNDGNRKLIHDIWDKYKDMAKDIVAILDVINEGNDQ